MYITTYDTLKSCEHFFTEVSLFTVGCSVACIHRACIHSACIHGDVFRDASHAPQRTRRGVDVVVDAVHGMGHTHGTADTFHGMASCTSHCLPSIHQVIPRWSCLIVDEAHHLKNESGGLHRSLSRMRTNFRVLLTGTPLQNNLHELWAMLNFLLPDLFTSSEGFDSAVDQAKQEVNTERLNSARRLLTYFMLRRTKEIVGLPRKTEALVSCPLVALQAEWYQRLLTADKSSHSVLTTSQLKTLIMQLRKVCNHPRTLLANEASSSSRAVTTGGRGKVGAKVRAELTELSGEELVSASGKLLVLDALLTELFAQGSRVLLFSTFTQTLNVLQQYLNHRGISHSRMDGSTNPIQRELDVRDFNAPGSPTKAFLISTRAGGVGINLASADVVVLYDSDWNPQVDLQAVHATACAHALPL